MAERVLITGGAGFIGTHVAAALDRKGYKLRVLDSLLPQVHSGSSPTRLTSSAEFIEGDVRDAATVRRCLEGVDSVVHLAAEVGVGQSMYAVDRYVSANDLGTAVLMQQLIDHPVRRIVVASSMSIYGEGLYLDAAGKSVEISSRTQASGQGWDPVDSHGAPLRPAPTPEWKRPTLASVYALTKYVQEQLTLNVAAAYGIESVALRLFNVYGPGQALSNPYTGVLAIFASRILNGRAPMIFEDGRQRRDFVHVEDVANAFVLALEASGVSGQVFNIASGDDRTVNDVARLLAAAMNRDVAPEISGKSRVGDIRHCIADISRARDALGYRPTREFKEGLAELATWVAGQSADDRVQEARRELEARGLVS